MTYLLLEIKDRIAHLKIDAGKSNAIDKGVLQEMAEQIGLLQQDPAVHGLIIYGKDGFFSSGIDLVAIYHYDDEEVRFFWTAFLKFLHQLISFDKPTIAAISGHSPAGGCVLALCCDYRIMVEGDYIIGLNEIPVGILVPKRIFELYRFWIGTGNAYNYLMQGTLLKPEDALKIGLVDEVVEKNQLFAKANTQMRKYVAMNLEVWRQSKLQLRSSLIEQFQADPEASLDAMLTQWWKPDNRAALRAIIDNLKRERD